jgi:hypothetical protein
MRSRRQVVAGVAGLAGAAMAVGFAAASQIVSPTEAAARARPPADAPVTVPVVRRALQSQVVTRGDTAFDGAVDVRIEAGGLETPAVVTGRVPAVGATVAEGDVLLEVAGRPVIALTGGLPTYRTLRQGSTGPDVTQLEQTLSRLGLHPGAVDGTYDAATATAVAKLYSRAGYEPPTPPTAASCSDGVAPAWACCSPDCASFTAWAAACSACWASESAWVADVGGVGGS